LIFASICSGIEGASVAFTPLGWRARFFAEWSDTDKFPAKLLKHHYPDVPNLGDITKFKDWPDATFDVLVGGTPCQSFSVAGLRQGMADPRGNLALVYLAIAERYQPRWIIWENVPGVLSSSGGRDFGSFIGGLVELGYGFAYRVLDAQFVRVDGLGRAVAQRRRRVFVVGYLGDWRRAAAVLFERESLFGHTAPRRETGKDPAGTLGGSSQSGGFRTTDLDNQGAFIPEIVSQAMSSKWSKGASGPAGDEVAHLVAHPSAGRMERTRARRRTCGQFVAVSDPISAHEGDTYTHEGKNNFRLHNVLRAGWRVRRLTPLECERLPGLSRRLYRNSISRRDRARWSALQSLGQCLPGQRRALAGHTNADGRRLRMTAHRFDRAQARAAACKSWGHNGAISVGLAAAARARRLWRADRAILPALAAVIS
jgi:DNA-cytosine methyltransferase